MDPLRLAIYVVQNRRAGGQKSHREKTNKENYHFKLRKIETVSTSLKSKCST